MSDRRRSASPHREPSYSPERARHGDDRHSRPYDDRRSKDAAYQRDPRHNRGDEYDDRRAQEYPPRPNLPSPDAYAPSHQAYRQEPAPYDHGGAYPPPPAATRPPYPPAGDPHASYPPAYMNGGGAVGGPPPAGGYALYPPQHQQPHQQQQPPYQTYGYGAPPYHPGGGGGYRGGYRGGGPGGPGGPGGRGGGGYYRGGRGGYGGGRGRGGYPGYDTRFGYTEPPPVDPNGPSGIPSFDTIFISNIGSHLDEAKLGEFFASVGTIKLDRKGAPRVYIYRTDGKETAEATITYEEAANSDRAIVELNGKDCFGSTVEVQRAEYRPPRNSFGTRGRGRGGFRGGRGGGDMYSYGGGGAPSYATYGDQVYGYRGNSGGGYSSYGGGGERPPYRGGEGNTDWNCPSCGNLNFARRDVCHRCPTPRPAPSSGHGGRAPSEAPGPLTERQPSPGA